MDYRNFEGHWPALEKVVFDIDAPSDQPVNMMIYIRNNLQYPFSNLFLIARLKTGDSLLLCDTLEYAMANAQGQWLGKGFLEVKESKLWWKENYELYGICNHSGGSQGGHYTAFIKNSNKKWYLFNDTMVTEVTNLAKLKGPQAYCFFYRKQK